MASSTRWTVTLASGVVLGDVEAASYEEALGRAIRLAARTGRTAERLIVDRDVKPRNVAHVAASSTRLSPDDPLVGAPLDDVEVAARVASGELVKLPRRLGKAMVRREVVDALRARLARGGRLPRGRRV